MSIIFQYSVWFIYADACAFSISAEYGLQLGSKLTSSKPQPLIFGIFVIICSLMTSTGSGSSKFSAYA